MVGPLVMVGGDATLPPWHAFQSQLVPHDGSQKSPGHQLFCPGCACASALPPRPANPNAAAIAADAIALLANLFMELWVRPEAMRRPSGAYRPDEKSAVARRSRLAGWAPEEVTPFQFGCADCGSAYSARVAGAAIDIRARPPRAV
jgi:hypothetical protein